MAVTLHTNLGDLKLELYCEEVPVACENFLALCATDYYNNTKFHRLIPGFMIQGGDPKGTGKGGQSIWGNKFKDEIVPSITVRLKHSHPHMKHNMRGIVSMANSGPDTNGSQFFITFTKQSHLDGNYTIIGRVIGGWETLTAMEKVPVGKKDRPEEEILLKSVTINANPIAERAQ